MTREEKEKLIRHLKYNREIGADYLITDKDADEIIKALEQESCDDAISRQAVIDGINEYFHDKYYQRTSIQDCMDCLIEDVIKDLQPVTPQPKYEDIAKAFQLGLAFGFGEKHDEMDKVIDEIKKVITPQLKTGQ